MTIALAGALPIPACALLVQLAHAHWSAANPLLVALLSLFWTTLAMLVPEQLIPKGPGLIDQAETHRTARRAATVDRASTPSSKSAHPTGSWQEPEEQP